MHHLATVPVKPTVAEVRALVRGEGSSLLDLVTDDQIDAAIKRDIERPAITLNLVAGSAICWVEFDALCDKLRDAVADGSVIGCDPATDVELRAFRKATPPHFDHAVIAHAQEVAGRQFFLTRRLFTLATDIVIETGADISPCGRALAVGCVLCCLAACQAAIAQSVIDAMPPEEWAELRASLLRSWMEPVRLQGLLQVADQ